MRSLLTKVFLGLLLSVSCASVAMAQSIIAPKVLVLTMFEVGKYTGDFPGEAQLWIENEKLDQQIPLDGTPHPLFYNPSTGIALTITNMGTVNAASTVMALGLSPKVDLSETFILVAGIAGGPPEHVSTGSAFWASYVVDGDLAHEVANYEMPTTDKQRFLLGCPGNFCKNGWAAGYEVFKLNKKLAEAAFETSKDVDMMDSPEAEAYRQGYEQKTARKKPFVAMGDVLSSGTYFHGHVFSRWADWWMENWTHGKGKYRASAMEDSGTMEALTRLSALKRADTKRVMVLRTISNYDSQKPGQTALQSLQAESGGCPTAIHNAYRVGSTVVHAILENPVTWKAFTQ